MELSPSTALLGLVLVFTSIFLHGCSGIIAQVEEDLERKPVPEKCESVKFGVPGHAAGTVLEAFEGEEPKIICPKDHYYFGYDIQCARSRKVCIAKTPADIQMPLCTYIYGFVVAGTNISDWPAKTLPDVLDPALIAPALRKKYETDNMMQTFMRLSLVLSRVLGVCMQDLVLSFGVISSVINCQQDLDSCRKMLFLKCPKVKKKEHSPQVSSLVLA